LNICDKLNEIYTSPRPKLSLKEVDIKAKEYQTSNSQARKKELQAELLKSFHDYFIKYVLLLKGELRSFKHSDTLEFLSLFLSGHKSASDLLGIARYIARTCKSLEPGDIYNELCIIFIELLRKYKISHKGVGFTYYITKYMRWTVKDWLVSMTREPLHKASSTGNFESNAGGSSLKYTMIMDGEALRVYSRNPLLLLSSQEYYDPRLSEENIQLPKLNLGWVKNPQSKFFATLDTYERFLLYLNYKEGLGVRQIGDKLGRTKDAINRHLQHTLGKLRNLAGWKNF